MRIFFFLLFWGVLIQSTAQNVLLDAPRHSDQDFIFRLNDQQAEAIFSARQAPDFSYAYLQHFVDSIPHGMPLPHDYPSGHYLRVKLVEDRVETEIYTYQPFQVHLLNNASDLSLQLSDSLGHIIPDARIKIGHRKVDFDELAQVYRIKKSNQQGLLSISWAGQTFFYQIDREYNRSFFNRLGNGYVKYGLVRYFWRPVTFPIRLPAEGLQSLLQGYPTYTISKTSRFFEKIYYKTVCLFDDYYCDWYEQDQRKYEGFGLTDKPIYRLGDTLYWKFYLMKRRNGKPFQKPIDLSLYQAGKKVWATESVKPKEPGNYHGFLVLEDSLNLRLDARLFLEAAFKGTTLGKVSLGYEDYELQRSSLSARLLTPDVFRGDTIRININALDENQWSLTGATLNVKAEIDQVKDFLADSLFLPDTLVFRSLALKTQKDQIVELPTNDFPAANFTLTIALEMLSADQERLTEQLKLNFWQEHRYITHTFRNDSITFSLEQNGQSKKDTLLFTEKDQHGKVLKKSTITLPKTFPLQTWVQTYSFEKGQWKEEIELGASEAGLQFRTRRENDTISIQTINPRQLDFHYFFYELDQELARGYTRQLDTIWTLASDKNAYLAVQYLWAGEMIEKNYLISGGSKGLKVDFSLPDKVEPGEELDLEVIVRDQKGRPQADVDLTVFALTSKFSDYQLPDIPDHTTALRQRPVFNTFQIHSAPQKLRDTTLAYDFWRTLAELETNEYYRFRFPKDSIYGYHYPVRSGLTQFAPFIDGQAVYIIEVDQKPVFFNWTSQEQAYAFKISPGEHQLRLRLREKWVDLGPVYFPKGTKTILNTTEDYLRQQGRVVEASNKLSRDEMYRYRPFLMPYQAPPQPEFSYLSQNDGHFLSLASKEQTGYKQLFQSAHVLGPIYRGNTTFTSIAHFKLQFNYEPGYTYHFGPELLKMIAPVKNERIFPEELVRKPRSASFAEEILTRAYMEEKWRLHLRQQLLQHTLSENLRSAQRNARVKLKMVAPDSLSAARLHTILWSLDTPYQLITLPVQHQSDQWIAPGHYRLIQLLEDSTYLTYDSLSIKASGLNYYRLSPGNWLPKDSFSVETIQLIRQQMLEDKDPAPVLRDIQRSYSLSLPPPGDWFLQEGYVYDESGEELLGVSILVQGTTIGTVTDLDGFYSLYVPPNARALFVSYTGYETQEIDLARGVPEVLVLETSAALLEEVIVTGYAVQNKKRLGYAVSKVETELVPGSLQGRVAGVSIEEGANNLKIRGFSSIKSTEILVVVNGFVYSGSIEDIPTAAIEEITVLKGEDALKLYGTAARNGVVVITTRPGSFLAISPTFEESEEAELPSTNMRDNFRDRAFWIADLRTDKTGQARARIHFPDDITNWRVFMVAVDSRGRSLSREESIRAFKSTTAQLRTPRFLVVGDSSTALGISNHLGPDSLSVTSTFCQDGQLLQSNNFVLSPQGKTEQVVLPAPQTDSIRLSYALASANQILDGEERRIPVFPKGLEKKNGVFATLKGDTTWSHSFSVDDGPVQLSVVANPLDQLRQITKDLQAYPYECNEQLASRLIAFLMDHYLGQPVQNRKIQVLIRRLSHKQNSDGLWAWWGKGPTSNWVSRHVIQALRLAEDLGYSVRVKLPNGLQDLRIDELEADTLRPDLLNHLELLQVLGEEVDYPRYTEKMKTQNDLSLLDQLRILRLRQRAKVPIDYSLLDQSRQTDSYGDAYLLALDTVAGQVQPVFSQNQVNILALEVLSQDSTRMDFTLSLMDYLLRNISSGNTYDQARFLSIALPFLRKQETPIQPVKILLNGNTIDRFPYFSDWSPEQSLKIQQQGTGKIYISATQSKWVADPLPQTDVFEIYTDFSGSDEVLAQGEPVRMQVSLSVKKEAEYVQLVIPIPAGCSYDGKSPFAYPAVHTEFYREKAVAFFRQLPVGDYQFELSLIPRYTGRYQLNPAQASLMYFPAVSGNNSGRSLVVE
jgi:hypothetical protein